ncbi:MAG: glycosyltransferase family 4 protein [Candidatus Hinthialibacter antarcticus]|nr:glycosyltransferase family 4 protein [Candidatus Hinthialibacter antarcticus]
MRVLFIEPSGAGGIASYTYALICGLAKQGVECHLFTSPRWEHSLPDGCRIYRLFTGKTTNPFAVLWRCWRLRNQVDIIHWQSTTHPELIRLLMKFVFLKGKPWVYTVHNVLPHEDQEKKKPLYQDIYQRVQGLIFHTHYSLCEFQNTFPDLRKRNIEIAHGEMGLLSNEPAKFDTKTDPKLLLFFGNIRPYKGLDILLQSFAEIRKEIPDVRLRIAGQPLQPFKPFEEIIQLLQIEDGIDLQLGYVPENAIANLIAESGIVVLPYRRIDQSGVLLLAMSSGKPVVASCVGGFPEVLRHEKTGLLVPPDDPRALAEALLRLLRDPEWANELGQAARLDVRSRFSWNVIAKQTLDFYLELTQ